VVWLVLDIDKTLVATTQVVDDLMTKTPDGLLHLRRAEDIEDKDVALHLPIIKQQLDLRKRCCDYGLKGLAFPKDPEPAIIAGR
jgi:hypothetical protein